MKLRAPEHDVDAELHSIRDALNSQNGSIVKQVIGLLLLCQSVSLFSCWSRSFFFFPFLSVSISIFFFFHFRFLFFIFAFFFSFSLYFSFPFTLFLS